MKKFCLVLLIALFAVHLGVTAFAQNTAANQESNTKVLTPEDAAAKLRQMDPNKLEELRKARQAARSERRRTRTRGSADKQMLKSPRPVPPSAARSSRYARGKRPRPHMLTAQIKHRKRIAKLLRIREVAAQEENTAVVDRVDKLIQKEKRRYQGKPSGVRRPRPRRGTRRRPDVRPRPKGMTPAAPGQKAKRPYKTLEDNQQSQQPQPQP